MKINQKIVFIAILSVLNVVLGFTIYNKVHSLTVVETDINKDKTTATVLKEKKDVIKEEKEEIVNDEEPIVENTPLAEPIVYDGMTLNELSMKLDRSLNSTLAGTGSMFAKYSIEYGVDPYLALAIALHETGCNWTCSGLVQTCNNVGGQKGSGCNGYQYFSSLEEGIKMFISNIYYNYYQYGLTNAEAMNFKYAADPNWSVKVNSYIDTIRAS